MLYKALCGSILIHIFLFAFLIFKSNGIKRAKPSPPIEITVIQKPKPGFHLRKKYSLPSVGSLLPEYYKSERASLGQNLGTSNDSDDISVPWGSGGGEFNRISEYSLMNRIQIQTENLLYYPAVLAAHKIEGNVNVRLVYDNQGDCDWPKTEITSDSTYLRVFILDLMKTVCRQNYAREVRGRKQTLVDFSFQFAITESDDRELKKEKSKVVGNVLLFYRNSHHSIAQWRLGPFTGLFPAPFVNLDFDWLKENWETYMEKKDPLREFK